ncbi:hypothetical protein MPTA5024_14855 [Microbispora sp. ATCC PTA-5024]|nr:hypothetical protein MPTA5024_14855 [Microbispora sp. ATCC PTA-5024]
MVDPSTGEVVPPLGGPVCRVVATKRETVPEQEPATPASGPVGKVVFCERGSTVSLLDTEAAGDGLDQARTVDLAGSAGDKAEPVDAVALSPDGTRIIALHTAVAMEVTEPRATRAIFTVTAASYDVATGRLTEVLYRADGAGIPRGLDLDGTGRNLLVTRPGEVGAVSGSQYRILGHDDLGTVESLAW